MSLSTFFKLALVNILSNLIVPLAGLIDVAFLGHLSEIRHLAGVTLATVLFNYIYWTFGFLRMGTTGMTAQAVGRDDQEAIALIGLRHGILALGIGLMILLLQQPLSWLGFTLLSASPEVKASGQDFYNALIWGAPATLINFVLVGWFLGRGQSGKVLLLSAINGAANVGLDYLLIVRWGWESVGAGWATATSQFLMLGVGLCLIAYEFLPFHIPSRQKIFDAAAFSMAFRLNREILIRTFVLVSTFALFTNLSSALGAVILTTNAVLLAVVSFSAYFIDGLAFATESFAGLFRGRGDPQELRRLVKVSGISSLGLGLAIALIFNIFPLPIAHLLTDHADIINQIPRYVLWLIPILGFGSIAYMLDGYFLGLTQGSILRQSSLISTLVGFLPMAIVAWSTHSPHLLWFALTLFMAARAITLGLRVSETLV
jgi:multidrug resistance protein, MATE family